MPRGSLEVDMLEEIDKKLPGIELQQRVAGMSPSPIAMKLGPGSKIPTAAVCLDDAMHAFTEARYALGESFAEDL